MSNSALLRAKIELALPALQTAAGSLLHHPRFADLYPEYLFTMHCMVRATVPLMATTLERARALAGADPVAAGVVDFLTEHLAEEAGHDEWLLQDLEVVGWQRTAVLRRPPSVNVAALFGAQYYWVLHYHPVALLGHAAVMEGYPPTVGAIERMIADTGYPRAAFRTLFAHAQLDGGHREELDRVLDRLALSPELTAVVGVSALHTVQLAAAALREVVERAAGATASRVVTGSARH